ncbi:hypothetical protein KEM54_006152 [Ascosphaera aggregata]|nr:hypothetical protein KEM54_006152 [Ascosphaera aggregata]
MRVFSQAFSAALSALALTSCAAADDLVDSQILNDPYPYHFPKLGTEGSGLFPMQTCNGFKLEEASIDVIQGQFKSGKLTTVQLVNCYLDRIVQTKQYLNAILQLNPDVFKIAQAIDDERKTGKDRGPLYGIPFFVKDNFATKDRMETTAGTWALIGNVVPRDAFTVQKLRKAGAVLMGKAAMSEWADMRSTNYSEGFSARGGQCRSAYNLTVNPGGSSSGSAISVGANLIPFALGTETDGSGIKPTVGLTSRDGVIPESLHQDTVGVFGKTVRDAVYALEAIYGIDDRDNQTLTQEGKTPKNGYAQYLTDKSALRGAKFGVPWESFWKYLPAGQMEGLLELIDIIKEAGAIIVNGTELPHYKTIVNPNGWDWNWAVTRAGRYNESEFTVIKVDFYNNLKTYLSEVDNTNIKSVEDVVKYNKENYGSSGGYPGVHPAFGSGQDQIEMSLESKGQMDATYWSALHYCQRTTREEGIDAALNHNGTKLDGLLVPPDFGPSIQIAAQAGYPVITVPAGVDKKSGGGMPFGLAIMNTAYSEAKLVKYASAIEDLQKHTSTQWKRQLPEWRGYLQRNLPLPL